VGSLLHRKRCSVSHNAGNVHQLGLPQPKLVSVLNYLYSDYGLEPASSSYATSAMVYGHWDGGAFYPEGGSSALAWELVR